MARDRQATRGGAIIAFCKWCIHDDLAPGSARQQITLCSSTNCPLWIFRPVSSGHIAPELLEKYEMPPEQPFGGLENKYRIKPDASSKKDRK